MTHIATPYLNALRLPALAVLPSLSAHQCQLLCGFDSEAVAAEFSPQVVSDHLFLKTMQPWTRALAIRLLNSMVPNVKNPRGWACGREVLQRIFRFHWGITATLDQLAVLDAPWLRLPDIGVIDITTVYHACNDPFFRRCIMPPWHPLLQAMERHAQQPPPPNACEFHSLMADMFFNRVNT